MTVLLIYLYVGFGAALLFCLVGNLPSILLGLSLAVLILLRAFRCKSSADVKFV